MLIKILRTKIIDILASVRSSLKTMNTSQTFKHIACQSFFVGSSYGIFFSIFNKIAKPYNMVAFRDNLLDIFSLDLSLSQHEQ